MYDLTIDNQNNALKRAEKLAMEYDINDKAHADKNPYKTVYELVIELNKFKK